MHLHNLPICVKIPPHKGVVSALGVMMSTSLDLSMASSEMTRLICQRQIGLFLSSVAETIGEEELGMGLWELLILSVGLAMDAFAVSICKGLSVQKLNLRHMVITGLYFGGFQAFMPLIGYLLGRQFETLIVSVDHWIAFILLALIGINMIRESREEAEEFNGSFAIKAMLPLALATSIDALAVGVTFAFLKVDILTAIGLIGVVTFVLSAVGVQIGNIFGSKFKSKAELAGGIVLVVMGLKILLEHLGILI